MKKILLLLMLFVPTIAFSQAIGFENKYINVFEADHVVWKNCLELNVEGIENPISETVLHGDTLINGVSWKILIYGKINVNGVKGLIRTEDSKVIFMPYPGYEKYLILQFQEGETIIYDFSLNIGDSFEYYGKIIKTDSVLFNDGYKHKRFIFEHGYSYIEGLGSNV